MDLVDSGSGFEEAELSVKNYLFIINEFLYAFNN